MRMRNLFFALLAISLFPGCARIRILRVASSEARAARENRVEQNQSSAVFGLVNLKYPLVLARVCPDHWEILETKQTGFQVFQSWITLSLYRPWTATVACDADATVPEAPLERPKPSEPPSIM
jgi:hypothetical protein